MRTLSLMVATALAALSCVAAPCGVVSFSMKVAQSTAQPQKVITSDQMKSFHEEADRLVWRGHPLLGDAFTVTATRKVVGKGEGALATAYPLDPSGETTIPKTAAPARFFRLQALPHIEVFVPIIEGEDIEVVAPIN